MEKSLLQAEAVNKENYAASTTIWDSSMELLMERLVEWYGERISQYRVTFSQCYKSCASSTPLLIIDGAELLPLTV